MSTLFMTHGLRPFPGLITRAGALATGDRLDRMTAVLEHVRAAGFDEGPVHPLCDVEDFWEDAIRIATAHIAALDAGVHVELRTPGPDWSPSDLARRMGPLTRSEQGGSHSSDNFEAVLTGLPQTMTGRTFTSCTHDSELVDPPADHLMPHLLTLKGEGHTAAVVKIAGHKQGVARIELDEDPRVIERHLHEAFDWTMIRLDGLADAFLVSPWIDMTCEYRVFVVDGQPVTGAGCIEEYTPLDHTGSDVFDSAVRVRRGNQVAATADSPIVGDLHTVRTHLAAAAPVIDLLASTGLRTYVVDMAYVADLGRSIVVEFNSIPNAGLYACDAQALAHALIRTEHKGYYDYTSPAHHPPKES
ncbi:MAG: hypothetical protein DI630_00760 [Gordonia sp. (in: high G+C Gram-positive bacteria)]|nr:MAG: hypothetical protein DI630_00760 [Gordonia sp. (in: high G+C Gram-positive bacteria)]